MIVNVKITPKLEAHKSGCLLMMKLEINPYYSIGYNCSRCSITTMFSLPKRLVLLLYTPFFLIKYLIRAKLKTLVFISPLIAAVTELFSETFKNDHL